MQKTGWETMMTIGLKGLFGLLAVVILLTGVNSDIASAARKVPGQKYYDYADGKWKVWKGHGRFVSDKSPIPKTTVRIDEAHPPGTIIIDTSERRLYYTLGGNKALKYAVGVGREGFEWSGKNRISRKAEWPGWTPPAVMRKREAAKGRILPAYMPGGPNNPLGARALYIGSSIYRIHGTNQPWTIGQAMSSGCIRMANDDVRDLYERAGIGTRVIVRQ
jgi:lipoprotein-anchoring transpeptidase ErfK/SrfK